MEQKFCEKCGKHRNLNLFSLNKSKKDGFASTCKECVRSIQNNFYIKNKDYYKQKKKDQRNNVKNKIKEYKDDIPCKDCGINYPHYVMDFDHINNDKSFNVADAITSQSWGKILLEIKKCELVCSNCHRIRTHNRSNKLE